ncbi:hypothetical protein HD554DRAFT_2115560 [Boletus coccyginus]|nr:hypothetical protein HD554DRAFT_2147707 [Boletus coccyginus]KAI9566668.1 hypothetical protein HD554DRAFT_2115560 [Boletus coccyginus]
MHFTLVIPAEQYKAQKAQWDSLLSSIKDRRARTLNVRDTAMVQLLMWGRCSHPTFRLSQRNDGCPQGEG